MKLVFYPTLIFFIFSIAACKRQSACFTTEKTTYKVGELVTFLNCSERNRKSDLAKWYFDDDSYLKIAGIKNVNHIYMYAGVFDVRLKYGGPDRNWEETKTITIE